MNLTIANLTLRSMLGRKRSLLLIPLPLILIGLTILGQALHPDAIGWQEPVIVGIGFAVVVPLMALIVGGSVVGSEIDDGTIVHILTKPIPRGEIIMAKLVVAAGITGLVTAVTMAICGVIVGSGRFALGLAIGALVASLCYCALFIALSIVSRRPVLIGLLYILLWEGLLGNLLSGTRSLSIEQQAISISAHIAPTPYYLPSLSAAVSIIMSAIFLAAATAIAVDRLRSFSVKGETS